MRKIASTKSIVDLLHLFRYICINSIKWRIYNIYNIIITYYNNYKYVTYLGERDVLYQNIIFYPVLYDFRWVLLCLSSVLTSDEINNVVRLSPHEKTASFTNPARFSANVFITLAETRRAGIATGTRQETPLSLQLREHDDEYFSYHRTSPNHRGFSSHPPKGGDCRRNDLARVVKNSSRGSKRLRVLDGARQRLHD